MGASFSSSISVIASSMEKLRTVVNQIAYNQDRSKLSTLHRSFIPPLSFLSSLYRAALSLRRYLYHSGIFSKRRLPLPVISVGNITWGGNGKTPMVEFIAQLLVDCGISPLILTREVVSSNKVAEGSPYYLHPSDHPGLIFVTHHLSENGDNYFTWRHNFMNVLHPRTKPVL